MPGRVVMAGEGGAGRGGGRVAGRTVVVGGMVAVHSPLLIPLTLLPPPLLLLLLPLLLLSLPSLLLRCVVMIVMIIVMVVRVMVGVVVRRVMGETWGTGDGGRASDGVETETTRRARGTRGSGADAVEAWAATGAMRSGNTGVTMMKEAVMVALRRRASSGTRIGGSGRRARAWNSGEG